MKEKREILEERLKPLLLENSANKKVIKKVQDELLKKGILGGTVADYFTQEIPIETISREKLYLITEALYNALNKEYEIINPQKYFTKEEIEKIKRKKIKKEIQQFPIIFKKVLKLSHDLYFTYLSAQQLTELYNKGVIRYRFETQREEKVVKHDDKIIKMPKLYNESLKEITENILRGTQITDTIDLNLLDNGKQEYEYNPKTLTLKIKKGEINIIDGFHRSVSIIKAVRINPEIEYITGCYIRIYSIEKAKRYIVQKDKQRKLDKKYINSLKEDNLANIVVKKLNENLGDIQGKITTNQKLITYGKALTLTSIMQKAIEKCFEIDTMSEVTEISNYLTEGFNVIMKKFKDELIKDVVSNRKKSVVGHQNIFIGYVYILSKIKDDENWKEKLENILDNIDFSIGNPMWEQIGLFKNYVNQKTFNDIINYFKKYIS